MDRFSWILVGIAWVGALALGCGLQLKVEVLRYFGAITVSLVVLILLARILKSLSYLLQYLDPKYKR